MRSLIVLCVVGVFGVALLNGPALTGSEVGEKVDKQEKPKQPEPKKDPDEPEPIIIKGTIAKTDPFDAKKQQSHHKVHLVKMLVGKEYYIEMKADKKKDKEDPSFDTYLRLEDSTGAELAENDDYITTDSRIVFTPKKEGEYRIIATTFDDGFTGSYTLTVTPYKAGVKGADPTVVLNLNGMITKNDPLDDKRNGSHKKLHTFKMLAKKTYTIDMISTQFDTWLRLEDANGNEIQEDDDSGGNLNSRIVYTPTKTGDFRIVATTFGAGAVGMYTLKISAK